MGLELRKRLIPVLQTFSSIMMITLTIDPNLFSSATEAYWHVRKRRAVAELVRGLKKAGHLKSDRYFYVVEFQKNGMPHFHLLLDADFVPHKDICRLWGRNRPASAPAWPHNYAESLEGMRPEFGSCNFKKGGGKEKFADAKHAACYALKYLTKHPENGFPQWVFDEIDAGRRIRLFETSRRLLPSKRDKRKPEREADEAPAESTGPEAASADCFCESCRDGKPCCEVEQATGELEAKRKTLTQRLEECGTKAVILEVTERKDAAGKVVGTSRRFMRMLELAFADVLLKLGCESADTRVVRLREGDYFRVAFDREAVPAVPARIAVFDAWNESGGVV